MMRSRWALGAISVFPVLSAGGCSAGGGAQASESAPDAHVEAPAPTCAAESPRAGQIDTSFGTNGRARVRFGADDDGGFFGLDVVGDAIVAAGWGVGGLGGVRMRLARFTPPGQIDPSFGMNGSVTTSFAPSTADAVIAVAVGHQRDGRIVAMGFRDTFHSESANIALARYEANGGLGAGFGVGGKSLIDLGGREEITDGLVLPDDSILVVGRRDEDLLVARATPAGELDTSFAAPLGYFAVHVGESVAASSVAVDANGRLLVAGTADVGDEGDGVVVRAKTDGSLDPSFGEGGKVVFGDPLADERVDSIAPSPDGGIVIAGESGPVGARQLFVRRFLADGSLDIRFGVGGVAEPAVTGGDTLAEDMVVLPGGGILVAGHTGEGHPLLVRYTCTGAMDPGFGEGGILPVDMGEYGYVHALRLHSHDGVLVGGADVGASPGPGTYGVVVRMWL
jgi:uncharacterized delta-60 repeat protein